MKMQPFISGWLFFVVVVDEVYSKSKKMFLFITQNMQDASRMVFIILAIMHAGETGQNEAFADVCDDNWSFISGNKVN